ncbi:hypothetical protein DEU56DRAFT_909159 [Suillus clintonianus]|uniref:uncharacterized protein n=1 Tax=Suillus clintonianus TaxID=1904413 RepID=UPI001B872DE1|nr:uncharacterized protein DEU56DRAFT_909159 [Suillus clintonianus]KAG2148844.1 hypothetical protein DEU56DRAFT_909159 [Suillus clintonianus]
MTSTYFGAAAFQRKDEAVGLLHPSDEWITMFLLIYKYNIEPFFFTSSINWIPSRYQEAPTHKQGDHITVTLPFVRTLRDLKDPSATPSPTPPSQPENPPADARINIHAPFPMGDDGMLFIDLFAIHMVRGVKTSAIISHHPESTWCRTSAKRLHSLIKLVGDSVYWQIIFKKSKDPTFVFLWYALYAWDESFELLYKHVSDLESKVLGKRIELTRDLHIQAHLLHYQSLLHNFEVSVSCIKNTNNPAMESDDFNVKRAGRFAETYEEGKRESTQRNKSSTKTVFDAEQPIEECDGPCFCDCLNIDDSTQNRRLTEATVRDSAAMKQAVAQAV